MSRTLDHPRVGCSLLECLVDGELLPPLAGAHPIGFDALLSVEVVGAGTGYLGPLASTLDRSLRSGSFCRCCRRWLSPPCRRLLCICCRSHLRWSMGAYPTGTGAALELFLGPVLRLLRTAAQ